MFSNEIVHIIKLIEEKVLCRDGEVGIPHKN